MKNRGLRNWQRECIERALEHYLTESQFFCQATPGAGKTYMAACLAHRLMQKGLIDLVICFAPSCQVVESFKSTFLSVLKRPLDGMLGSAGVALTYQAMDHCKEGFWKLLERYRVFVVFDEIHHCAGQDPFAANLWGRQILGKVDARAEYSLALSGTPWRSDEKAISIARYTSDNECIIVDYRYGLRQAVIDRVCRAPRIVVLDNDEVIFTEETDQNRAESRHESITSLLNDTPVTYEQLLRHEDVVRTLLALGCQKLNDLRKIQPNAAGLIVASSIEHAFLLGEALKDKGESYKIVTIQTPNAQKEINEFRANNCRWIISVGMISEGTDIPRLQVCCYFSRIRTELHFRQVLGRVLRRIGSADDEAWLYVLAEPELMNFATRVAEDLPEDLAVLNLIKMSVGDEAPVDGMVINQINVEDARPQASAELELIGRGSENVASAVILAPKYEIAFSDKYRSRLLSVF